MIQNNISTKLIIKTYDTKRKGKGTYYLLPQPYTGHWRRTWTGDPCIYPGKALRSVCGKHVLLKDKHPT
jgi:hypothetical protein